MISKQSKIFFLTFLFLIIISISLTYHKYVTQKNFVTFTDEEAFHEALLEE